MKLLITQIPKPYVFSLPLTIDSKQWPGNGPATRITLASIPWGRGEGRGREEYEDYLLLSSSPSLAVRIADQESPFLLALSTIHL